MNRLSQDDGLHHDVRGSGHLLALPHAVALPPHLHLHATAVRGRQVLCYYAVLFNVQS